MAIKGLVADIDGVEKAREAEPEPGVDVIMFPIPMATYKALSDAATRKNMTVAQLMSKALSIAVGRGGD